MRNLAKNLAKICSAYGWLIVENAKIFRSYAKYF